MNEKREFPILNGKLLSDLDLNGYKLLGLVLPEGGGGGSSVEVVAPSANGAGKAADAKAVYEELLKKQAALSTKQLAAANSGITAPLVSKLNALPSEVPDAAKVLPRYRFTETTEATGDVVTLEPFTNRTITVSAGNTVETIPFLINEDEAGDYMREFIVAIDCFADVAPQPSFWFMVNPRTDEETDLMCEPHRHNVFFITEESPYSFLVARWVSPMELAAPGPDEELPPEEV
jgi:hypothetical protein